MLAYQFLCTNKVEIGYKVMFGSRIKGGRKVLYLGLRTKEPTNSLFQYKYIWLSIQESVLFHNNLIHLTMGLAYFCDKTNALNFSPPLFANPNTT